VLLEKLLGRSDELDGSKFKSSVLEAADDRTNESTLDSIWLDSNESLFARHVGEMKNYTGFI